MTETIDAIEEPRLGQKIAAEVIGTFGLVFFAVGSAVFSATLGEGQGAYVGIALAFGFSIVAFGYAFGRVSGAHFNPAVSLGAAVSGRMTWSTAGIYMAAQIVGGLLGGTLIFVIMLGFDGFSAGDVPLGANAFGDQGSGLAMWAALLVEFVATLSFVWVVLGVTDNRAAATTTHAVLSIGFALTLIHLALIGLTGTSVNPARSIGVAFFSGSDAIIQLWVFIVAPLLGGLVAGLTYPAIFGRGEEPMPGSGFSFGGPKQAKAQAMMGGYDQQQWGQPQQQWGQQPQQWGQPQGQQPQQQWGAPDQGQAAPAPQHWEQPGAQQQGVQQPGAQQWGQPQPPATDQWGQPVQPPATDQWGQPVQPPNAAQQWGQPTEDDDDGGRTQVRRPD